MTRYFKKFFNADPMDEISEAEAKADGTYAVRIEAPLPHYVQYLDHELYKVVYAGLDDPAPAIADHLSKQRNVRIEIHSPVERDRETVKWRTWYVNADGAIEKILEPKLDTQGRYLGEAYLGPSGDLRSYTEHHYDEDGNLTEVVTHNPDGSVLNREEVD